MSRCCPACGEIARELPYEVRGVPAHSVLLMDSRHEAVAYPTANISLCLCEACGFVFNHRFDAALNAYSPAYEETQHFSSHFNGFARDLARRWIERYGLRGRTLVEIGCGKGEFLALMCRLGDNRGIGIDPSCRPERHPEDDRRRLTFYRELYSPQHARLPADAILCRHTLEHIAPVKTFLEQIRTSIGRRDTLLLFELPETSIVFEECRFWDIYYEHCSYFTGESLSRLFRSTGFDVLELERDFDDQYLLLAARPSRSGGFAPDLSPPEATPALARRFSGRVEGVIERWRQWLIECRQRRRSVAVWGGGSKCVAFLTTLLSRGAAEDLAAITQVVDINPHKQGKYLPGTGHRVVAPAALQASPPEVVLVMNPVYRTEVQRCLHKLGLAPELLTTTNCPSPCERPMVA